MEKIKNLDINGYLDDIAGYIELSRLRRNFPNDNHSRKTYFLENARYVSPIISMGTITFAGIKIGQMMDTVNLFPAIGVVAALAGGQLTYKLMTNCYKKAYIKFLEKKYDIDASVSNEELHDIVAKVFKM